MIAQLEQMNANNPEFIRAKELSRSAYFGSYKVVKPVAHKKAAIAHNPKIAKFTTGKLLKSPAKKSVKFAVKKVAKSPVKKITKSPLRKGNR